MEIQEIRKFGSPTLVITCHGKKFQIQENRRLEKNGMWGDINGFVINGFYVHLDATYINLSGAALECMPAINEWLSGRYPNVRFFNQYFFCCAIV